MVPGYVIFGIFLIIVYSLTHENSQFAATASVIRQIWSGSCRLSCRPSALSDGGISGLSGLVGAYREEQGSSNCICESCPCALIENFLKTCRPATRAYSYTSEFISTIFYALYNMVYEIYKHVVSALQCGASCRRHAQLVGSNTNYSSNENFTLVEDKPKLHIRPQTAHTSRAPTSSAAVSAKTLESDEASKISSSKASDDSTYSALKSSATSSGTKYSSVSSGLKPSTSIVKEKISQNIVRPPLMRTFSDETLKPTRSVADSKMNCSKCVEQGKTCLGGCPNAEKRKKKK